MNRPAESSATDSAGPAERRRFYVVQGDLRHNPSDYAFVNEDEALINGRWRGRHAHPAPGYRLPFYVGVPELRAKPKLVVGADRDELLDIYGFDRNYVSSRAKALLSEIDPQAFEFVECDTVDGNGRAIDPYWMFAVIRVASGFDEARSDFITFKERNPDDPEAATNPTISVLNDIYMPEDFPADAHAFRFVRYRTHIIVDGAIVDAWRAAGLTGAEFTPLQPPTEVDMADHLSFANYPYWTQKAQRS
jgi:hypothetical protein